MARAKNRGYQQKLSPSYTIRRWRLGEYIRLSKEDLKKSKDYKDDSNSVKNQRDLLNDFYQMHIDEFESVAEYVDDGHTGTDADRENFQRLLADVMSGKINCVIVKDLSRFARNYSDAGSLIDNLFVQMGVRFISLAENVDSYKDPDSVSSIIVPITNVMNDQYCYQTSKKIRQVFDYKRRNGQYIGSFAPYGYIKDPKDKHQLIVDEDAAEIVKQIYALCLQGTTKRHISFYLNEHGVPSPTAYRRAKGLPVSSTSDDPMWGDRVVWNILTNPIYTGDLVQGRRRVKSYKVHEIEAVPEDEWVTVPDTHEAIIDKESFEKVQALLKRDTRSAPKSREASPVQRVPTVCRLRQGHHPEPERKKCLLRLFYLQKPFPAGLLHALYQAQSSGGCRPVCYSTAGAFGGFLFGAGGSYQFGSNQKKPVFPTGRFDYHQGAGAGKSHPIQTVYLSRLERR